MFGVKYLWLIDRIFGASHMAEVLVITLSSIGRFFQSFLFGDISKIHTKSLYTTPLCVLPYSHICVSCIPVMLFLICPRLNL